MIGRLNVSLQNSATSRFRFRNLARPMLTERQPMSEQLKPLTAFFAVLWTTACAMAAAPATIDVDVNRPGIAIPASFYGLMTEEINHSYDGGLFAELLQNRTFQDPQGKSASD